MSIVPIKRIVTLFGRKMTIDVKYVESHWPENDAASERLGWTLSPAALEVYSYGGAASIVRQRATLSLSPDL